MIIKEWDEKLSTDKRIRAGQKAEKQMAFYLRREFGQDKNIFVFNNLRLVDGNEVAQIDHLVVHPYGFALIESKSVTGAVEINEYEEWSRKYQGKSKGMPSPLKQLEMQRKLLVGLLNNSASEILGKLLGIQKHFGRKYDCVAAISDQAEIDRKKDTEGVYKADAVTSIIRAKIKQYKSELISGDAVWFNKKELKNICDFLVERDCPKAVGSSLSNSMHEERKNKQVIKPRTNKTEAQEGLGKPPFICDKCGGVFEIRFGHSFYLYCPSCKRRPMPLHPKCPICEHEATLKHEIGTRIIQYECKKEESHFGVFHKNKEIYKRDEK